MNTLPMLEKNSYLTLVVKDNHIFANLAYADFSAGRTYILSDITDLSPLKFRMDDVMFNSKFWREYFEALEREFGWDMVNREWQDCFKFIPFENEGVGVSGIKILVDDNQPFFSNILTSLKEFSKDITLRVIDDNFVRSLEEGLAKRLGYEDILWIDLDFSHFSIYRLHESTVNHNYFSRDTKTVKKFVACKIDWDSEIGLVDSIKSSKLQAFLATEVSSEDLLNRWANFIAHCVENVSDILIEDVIRSFTTVQLLSLKSDNREKLQGFGQKRDKCAVILTGKIPRLLPKKLSALSIIDGLELEGSFDLFIDSENKLLSFGKNLIEGSNSRDMLVIKGDVLDPASKVLIPELRSGKAKNKIIYSAKVQSQDFDVRDIYAINPSFEIFPIPYISNKVIIEGELKNSAVLNDSGRLEFDFVSSTTGVLYDSLIVDGRFRPIIYGPRNLDNKLKLQVWLNGNKE